MTYFKKRSSAIVIAVIVVIFGTLFGVHRSVNSQTAKVEMLFYNGVYMTDKNYTQPSIESQLEKRADAALGLVTVGAKFGDVDQIPALTDALRQSRLVLVDAESISEKYAANEKMQAAYTALYNALFQFDMTESTLAAVKSYASVLDGAQGVIQKSDYNRMVSEYIGSALGAFPVNILKNLAFVQYPEYFGAEG
jgi:hypothetical protein